MATPTIRFSEFDPTKADPSGSRHLTNHAAYVKQLGTTAGQYLSFADINVSSGKQTTLTKAVVGMADSMGDATSGIYNMKFWVGSSSDWGGGTYSWNGLSSGTWIQNITLNDTSGYTLSNSLPNSQNWWRQDHHDAITASGSDDQVTEYMYLSITIDTNVTPSVYGGSSGGFKYRMTYDYR